MNNFDKKFLFFGIFFLSNVAIIICKENKLNSYSEIIITIYGSGEQKLLSNSFLLLILIIYYIMAKY